jgi:hypothetical protein
MCPMSGPNYAKLPNRTSPVLMAAKQGSKSLHGRVCPAATVSPLAPGGWLPSRRVAGRISGAVRRQNEPPDRLMVRLTPGNAISYLVALSDGKPGSTFPDNAISYSVALSDGKPGSTFPDNAISYSVALSDGKPGSTFPDNAISYLVALSDGKPGTTFPDNALLKSGFGKRAQLA